MWSINPPAAAALYYYCKQIVDGNDGNDARELDGFAMLKGLSLTLDVLLVSVGSLWYR